MKTSARYRLLRVSLLNATCLAISSITANLAPAQTATAPAPAPPATATTSSELSEIVVTGTTIAQPILQTSFAITVVDQEALKTSPAIGLAALLNSVPGLYGEASGGEDNLNISARGLRGGFLEYISLQEDGLPLVYNGYLEELELRPDLTFDQMQVTRGGPSGVLTSNGAGSIVNFISRKATDTPQGEVSVSYFDFGEIRTDAFYGTPIGHSGNTSFTIGGYYRKGDGVKNVGYDVNDGGQLRTSLTHKFENGGSLTISYKHIDDHTQFYLPQPVEIHQDGNVQRISPIPGFNAETDYLQGPDLQVINVKTPNGDNQTINLQDGIWERSDTLTFQYAYDWQNGLRWKDSLRISKINWIDNDLRNLGGNDQIYNATTFLSSNPLVTNLISTFAAQGAVRAELVKVDTGTVIANPSTMNGNGLLAQMGANQYAQSSNQIINDSQFNFHTDKNDVTLGLLTWNIDMDVFQNAVDFLMDITNNAHLIDVAAVNSAGQVVGHLTDNGVLQYDADSYGNGTVSTKSNSIYLNDQYQPWDPLRIDAGVRFEKVRYTNVSENVVNNPVLTGVVSPNVLADLTGGSYGNGTYTNGRWDLSGTAWTAGANYLLTDNLAVYGRYSNAFDTGIANFAVFCPGDGCYSPMTRLRFGEVGVRFATPKVFGELIGFRSVNTNISDTIDNTGQQVFIDDIATGVEFNAKWRPSSVFVLELTGVSQRSRLTAVGGITSLDGNQIDRLPDLEAHLTPTVTLPSGRASAYVTESYYGKRYGDLANTLELDPYTDLTAGISFKATSNTTLSVQGTNLTDRFSFTEGNPRGNSVIAGTNAYGFARANLPRVIKATVDVKF